MASSVQPAQANAEVVVADVLAAPEASTPPSELLYGGLTAHDAACALTADSSDCVREWGDAIINGAQCIVGLFGVGRILMAKRIAKKIGEIQDAMRRASVPNREVLFRFLSLLVGECWDTYWAVLDVIDCMGWNQDQEQQQVALPRAIRPTNLPVGKEVTA